MSICNKLFIRVHIKRNDSNLETVLNDRFNKAESNYLPNLICFTDT
jgi:hypothetical protein